MASDSNTWTREVKHVTMSTEDGGELQEWKATINVNPQMKGDDDKSLGAFVGFKGNNIKAISGKAKKAYCEKFPDDDLGYLKLHVTSEGWVEGDTTTKFVSWNDVENCSNVEEFNNFIVKELQFCEDKVNGLHKPKPKPKKNKPQSKPKVTNGKVVYGFWAPIHSRFIGKMIGIEGSNIDVLRSTLQQKCDLDKMPSVFINDEGRKVTNDGFKLKCKNEQYHCGEENSGVWIVVRFFGAKSFKSVSDACQKFLDKTFKEDLDNDFSSVDGEVSESDEELEEENDNPGDGW